MPLTPLPTPKPKPPYRPPPPVTTGQTLMWFLGGLALMFLLISVAFALKLNMEGRLFRANKPEAALSPRAAPRDAAANANNPETLYTASPAAAETPVTPISSADFAGGAENIIPPEASHLNKPALAPSSPKQSAILNTPPSATSDTDPLSPVLLAWAAAWEHKDVDAYLAYYAPDFKPSNGLSIETWKEQRRAHFAKPGSIAVKLANIQLSRNGDHATARFSQTYTADKHSSSEARILEFVHRDGRWLILAEAADN